MKSFLVRVIWILVGIFFVPTVFARSQGDSRGSELFVGGGLNRQILQLKPVSGDTTFAGWGADGIAGVSILAFDAFGFSVAGQVETGDLLNTATSSSQMEKVQLSATGVRAGFFYRHFELGGGVLQNKLKVQYVSSSSLSSSEYEGQTPFYFVSANFDYQGRWRAQLDGRYQSGELTTSGVAVPFTRWTVGMQFFLILF